MPYDFKKEKLYRAGDRPEIVAVPGEGRPQHA